MNRKARTVILALTLTIIHLGMQAAEQSAAGRESRRATGLAQAPYLQAVSPTSMAFLWRTHEPAYGWVEYGETPTLGRKQDASVLGLKVANTTEHRIVVEGLRPGCTYHYRVVFKPIRNFQAYKVEFGPEEQTEIRPFRTLPSARQEVAAVIFNDLHNDTNLFGGLRAAVGNTPFDFSVFNGDCFADPATAQQTFGVLAGYSRGIDAGSRPAFFLRGNHETRGAYSRQWPALVEWPGGKPYFAFSAGSVRFVMLDLGEDKPDDHPAYSGLVDFARFRQEQTQWLKTEVASPAYRQAAWRVLIYHIPLYRERASSGGSATNAPPRAAPRPDWQDTWLTLLRKADLAINGHTHTRAYYPAGTIGNPYPVYVGGGPKTNLATVMILRANSRELSLRVLDSTGREVLPAFNKRR